MKMKSQDILIGLSVVSAVLAGGVSLFGLNLWLAGTQWILIAIILGIYGIFVQIRS